MPAGIVPGTTVVPEREKLVTVTVLGAVKLQVAASVGATGSQRRKVSPRMPSCLKSSASTSVTPVASDGPALPKVMR